MTGRRVGVYEVIALLGVGGMGEVYRARDTKLGRDVAIKILPPALTHDADRLWRFEREARMLAALNHPHIATIFGVEDADGLHAIVMELVDGETLADRIRQGPLPLEAALGVARQIADALDAAHEQGIVHRDLKPANIKIRIDGTVKVLDFGLAKAIVGDVSSRDLDHAEAATAGGTRGDVILGTPAYMSPEQTRGKPLDKRTDIWAFGCVVYEMLVGRSAFAAATASDTIAGILSREPDWSALPASTPARVTRLLQRCLEKDSRLRLRDIGDARTELADAQPDLLAAAVPSRVASRRWERLAWGTLAVLLAIASAAVATMFRAPIVPAEEVRFRTTVPPGVVSNFAQLALSPDGRTLAVAPSFDGPAPLWLRPLDSTSGRFLSGTEGAIFPFWSPDGRSLGFFADRKLKRIDVESAAVDIIANVGVARGGTWLPDGSIVFAPNLTSPLSRVSATGGAATPFTHLDEGQTDHRAPVLLPGGQHFLYYARGTPQARGVYVARLDGSEARRLLDADAAATYSASGHLLFVRQEDLFAQPFDTATLTLTGAAFRVTGPIGVNPGVSLASLATSASGAVAYGTRGYQQFQLGWFDRSGNRGDDIGPLNTAVANASLSPDGKQIAFSRVIAGNWDIWLIDIRGALSRLTSEPSLEFNPIWMKDGRTIIFQSTRGGSADLYARSVGGERAEELILSNEQQKSPSDVSADNAFLLFTAGNAGTRSDIWVMSLTGDRAVRPLVQSSFDDRDGRFSPDGRWIAYQSNESGRNEVYLQPFPNAGVRTQVSTGGGQQARWGRNGEIFYVAQDGQLTSVPVRASETGVQLGQPAALFRIDVGATTYIAADDGRFIMNAPTGAGEPPSIEVLLNWRGRP